MQPEELESLATLQPPNAFVTPAYLDFFNSTEWDLVYSIIPPYIFTVCLTGIVGNFFVLLVFLFQGSRWSVPEIYLGNLVLADLLLLVCLPFWAMNILNYFMWSYGEIMCKVVNLSINVNMYTSIYMLVMVNVDRYLALALTMKAMWLRRKCYAKFICVVLWLFGVGMGASTACIRKLKDIPGHRAVECHLDYPNTSWRLAHLLQLNLVGFALPILVITFCCVNIIRALKRRRHIGYCEDRNDKKATALVCAVTLLFLICWGKYFKRKVSSIYNRRKRSLDATALQRTVLTSTTTASQIKPVVLYEKD
ncbi:B1 bradykinin receptor-like isoform X2 [Sinocyclocheilus anshuiensis]|uniref:B1 bradykinin receptor-like isoform X2 n=1 Tax=Sinocyclocheilus anshuiensis TaxID=1608454 RepID=UPI0007B88E53|nr:PREDICTED: B1 bradykinin receptor-like isoform X2 [Sinocyclocheilus anshuiensis]